MKKTIKIEGMSCMHCSMAVKKALMEVEGVKSVDVNLEAKAAEVEIDNASNEKLKSAVTEAGYEVVGIE